MPPLWLAALPVLLVVWAINPNVPQSSRNVGINILQLVSVVTLSCLALRLHRHRGLHLPYGIRLGWFLLGTGPWLPVGMSVIWAIYRLWNPWAEGLLGPPDQAYIASYPLEIAAAICWLRTLRRERFPFLLLDSAITTGGVCLLGWFLYFQRLWDSSHLSQLQRLGCISYSVFDSILLFVMLLVVGAPIASPMSRNAYRLICSGFFCQALVNVFYTSDMLKGSYVPGQWYELGWVIAVWITILGAGAAYRAERVPREQVRDVANSPKGPRIQVVLLPLFLGLAVAISAAGGIYRDGDLSLEWHIAVMALGTMLAIRQSLTLLENFDLTGRLRSIGDQLEREVQRRTEQMTYLHRLIAEMNSTLEEERVWDAARENTLPALRAEAVLFWCSEGEAEEGAVVPLRWQEGEVLPTSVLRLIDKAPITAEVQSLIFTSLKDAGYPKGLACLRAPLVWQKRIVGMIGVLRSEPFSESEHDMLEDIGRAVGTALHNARSYAAVRHAADRDSVTGLLNHRALHQVLQASLNEQVKQGGSLILCIADINNFKLFNDTYGHPAGDEVLRRVAVALTDVCPADAVIGRYGGDEFCVVVRNYDRQQGERLAALFQARLNEEVLVMEQGGDAVPVALALGVAVFPEDGRNRHELVAHADRNMYAAKFGTSPVVGKARQSVIPLDDASVEDSFAALDAMITAIDNKDHYTRAHSEDVTEHALRLAEALGASADTLRTLRIAGLLHDVGKIGVPDEILRKPGRLTGEEFDVMRRHPLTGALMVGALPGMDGVVAGIRSHHERWDGQGYPDMLSGQEIPYLGRILAIADAFSAMTFDRPYRRGLSVDEALEQIRANIGTQFDPEMARVFLRMMRDATLSELPLPTPLLAKAA